MSKAPRIRSALLCLALAALTATAGRAAETCYIMFYVGESKELVVSKFGRTSLGDTKIDSAAPSYSLWLADGTLGEFEGAVKREPAASGAAGATTAGAAGAMAVADESVAGGDDEPATSEVLRFEASYGVPVSLGEFCPEGGEESGPWNGTAEFYALEAEGGVAVWVGKEGEKPPKAGDFLVPSSD